MLRRLMIKVALLLFVSINFTVSMSADDGKYGPRLSVEKVNGSSGCMAVRAEGKYLYVAGNNYFSIYDISKDLAKPNLVSSIKGLADSRQIAVCNGIAYVTGRAKGLWIVDVKNPGNPKLIRRYHTIELATGIAATENVVFVAQRVYGIQILDVTDPAHPKHISQIRTSEAQSVAYRDGLLFVGDWGSAKLTVIDVNNLRKPRVISQGGLDGFGDGVFLKGNLCFCSTGHDAKSGLKTERKGRGRGLEVFSIADPAKPVKLGVFKFPVFLPRDNDYWTVRVYGNTAFCVDSHNGFYMVDVSDPAHMKGLGYVLLPTPRYGKLKHDCCASLSPGDGVVYIAGKSTGLYVLKTPLSSQINHPSAKLNIPPGQPEKYDSRLIRYNPGSQIYRVAVNGNHIYAAAYEGGLKLIEIAAGNLKEMKSWNEGVVKDVTIFGDRLYMVENDTLVVCKIKTDGGLVRLGSRIVESGIDFIHVMEHGKYAVVSCGTRFLVFDTTNPEKMRQVFKGIVGGILYADMFPTKDSKGVFPVNWHARGIAWYDLNGKKPKEISRNNPPMVSQMNGIDYFGNGEFFMPWTKGTIVYMTSDNPGKFKTVTVKGTTKEMPVYGIPTVDKNIVAVSSRRTGKVVAVDLSNPETPVVVKERSYDLSKGNCGRVVFYKGRMIIPAGHYGLFMENVSN